MYEEEYGGEVFPSRSSLFVFILYVGLFVNQAIIVTSSQLKDKSYGYDVITVVLMVEIIKLIVCFACFIKSASFDEFCNIVLVHWQLLLLYMVPSFLYCVYNNLTFYNLQMFDPTTYFILLDLRVVVTGIVYQVVFKTKLTGKQWQSLFILTFGCMSKQFGQIQEIYNGGKIHYNIQSVFSFAYFGLLMQIFCSCFAGVFTEKLIKRNGSEVPLLIQNVFMYADSIVWNLIFFAFNGNISKLNSSEFVDKLMHASVLLIVINNSIVGITTSLFLQNLDSILKNFASSLVLVFTAIFSWIIFGIVIDAWTTISICIVIYATHLYSKTAIVNRPKNIEKEVEEEHIHELLLNHRN